MRKTLFAILALATCAVSNAQVTLYDNGPMVTHAGQGAGGLDLSMCSTDPNTAGLNRKFFGPDPAYFSMADDFTLAANATMTSAVVYGYETGANTPTWTGITVNLWSGTPGAGGSIIATATSTSVAQTNIYRCFNGVFVDTARKINAITANFNNISLNAGTTYWISTQITTGGASGWANMVMDPNPGSPNNPITRAGNGLQFRQDPVTLLYNWLPAISGTTNIVQSEFPMLIKGNAATTTETLAPISEQILFGTTGSGGNLASWAADDANARQICKFFVPNSNVMTRVNLNYTTTKTTPTAINFNVKIATHTPGSQAMTLRVQNKVSTAFVDTNVVLANVVNGSTYSGAAGGTLSNYVGGGGAMTGQIEIKQTSPATLAFPCTSYEFGQMVVTG